MSHALLPIPLPLVLVLAVVVGCGDDGTSPDAGDSGVDARPDAPPVDSGPSTEPTMPAMPVLTPCAPGWSEVPGDAEHPAFCEPYDDLGIADCPPTEAHYPGTPGCAPVTTPCPADGWPTDVPEATVVYVRADAPAGGDGTRGTPFQTVAEALVASPTGVGVAIAPGNYGPVVITRDAALRGACGDVIFSSVDTSPAIRVDEATVTVDNVRISGAGPGEGLRAVNSTLHISRLALDNLRGVGMEFTNSVVEASRLRFHDIADTAVYALSGTRLTATQLAFTGTMTAALRSVNSDVTAADLVFHLEGVEPQVFGAERSGDAIFERVAVIGDGTLLLFDGPTLTLRDSSIVGKPSSASAYPNAIIAFGGSRATLERTTIRRIWSVAAAAADPESELVATDVVIRGDAERAVRHGIEIGEGAHASLSRVFVDGVESIAVLATDDGSTVSAEDLIVRETQPSAGGLLGRALQIQRGAHLTADRVYLVDNHEVAVVAGAPGATIELRDAVIERTHARGCAAAGCPAAGIGLGAYLGGRIIMTRFRVSESALAGAQLAMDGEMDLDDGVINGHPVGVNLQLTGFDLERLTHDVAFQDNGINLDATELPVPAPTTPR